MMSVSVISWWYFLCTVSAINVTLWSYAAILLHRRGPAMPAELYRSRRVMLILSAIYVFGCAYRSVFLVYDVPRICLHAWWPSSALIGRSVATVAELCFVAQWALLLREKARATTSRLGAAVSLALVPLIAIAETCSWYSVLTTSNLGHVAEESIWGLCVALLLVCVAVILPRCPAHRRPALLAWCAAGVVYVAFMFLVDVPMYWARWVADEAVGRHYLSIAQGLVDIAQRRVVSRSWHDWRHEVAWMSLYFSVAVWISISLVLAPAMERRERPRDQRLPDEFPVRRTVFAPR